MHYISTCFSPNHGSYQPSFALYLTESCFLVSLECFFFLSAMKNDFLIAYKRVCGIRLFIYYSKEPDTRSKGMYDTAYVKK